MQISLHVLNLACAVLARNYPQAQEAAWDSRGTAACIMSHAAPPAGTRENTEIQGQIPTVPLSQTSERRIVGQSGAPGTPFGTVAGQPMSPWSQCSTMPAPLSSVKLPRSRPSPTPTLSLQHGARQAGALGWSARDLLELNSQPERPGPTYRRLSRVDCAELLWLLPGRPVVAMTVTEALIQACAGTVVYRKCVESVSP
jgi:hypothetical protein